ncbi:MAG: type II toxin-antitoxin system VapC family toxin [Isosphaeraceae bacterium]|nr:type II toxin-antitoxin system VapC family toxin [Isosphaeraceae bacterium]
MPKRVLDTNILITHFHLLRPLDGKGPGEAEDWARALIRDKASDAIVSPVEVEFLCGVLDEHERELREAYLRPFKVIDEHRTLPQDWQEARRLAKHPGFQASPRDLGDCLIVAIAERLKHVVVTLDKGLLRQQGRARQRRP